MNSCEKCKHAQNHSNNHTRSERTRSRASSSSPATCIGRYASRSSFGEPYFYILCNTVCIRHRKYAIFRAPEAIIKYDTLSALFAWFLDGCPSDGGSLQRAGHKPRPPVTFLSPAAESTGSLPPPAKILMTQRYESLIERSRLVPALVFLYNIMSFDSFLN
jgi:hypothetical protein